MSLPSSSELARESEERFDADTRLKRSWNYPYWTANMIFLLYPRLLVQVFHNFPALTPADPAIALLEDQIRAYLGTGNFFQKSSPVGKLEPACSR
jgi:hypothetical protein